jgi:hypothetical protein
MSRETIKRLELIPSRKATDAAIEETTAAWLEGIPPVRQAIVSSSSLPLRLCPRSRTITALRSWAKNQLEREDKKMGFSIKALTDSARIAMATDI